MLKKIDAEIILIYVFAPIVLELRCDQIAAKFLKRKNSVVKLLTDVNRN